MATGMEAVDQEIKAVVQRLQASDIVRRLEILELNPTLVESLTAIQAIDYLRSGRLV